MPPRTRLVGNAHPCVRVCGGETTTNTHHPSASPSGAATDLRNGRSRRGEVDRVEFGDVTRRRRGRAETRKLEAGRKRIGGIDDVIRHLALDGTLPLSLVSALVSR